MSFLKSSDANLDFSLAGKNIQLSPTSGTMGTGLKVWYSHSTDPTFNTDVKTIEVWSSSANDTSAGTGARTVEIVYIDENQLEVTETLTMNGTTVVSPTSSGYRVNKLKILTSGSGNGNAGAIYAGHSSKASFFNVINIGENVSRSGFWSTPSNKKLYLKNMTVANGGANGGYVSIRIHDIISGMDYSYSRYHIPNGNASGVANIDLNYMEIPNNCDFYCAVSSAVNTTILEGVINAVLV